MSEDSRRQELNFEKSKVPKDRIEGAILGAAIGDALGWPQEGHSMRPDRPFQNKSRRVQIPFQAWRHCAGGRYNGHEEEIGEGEYSDDTQLLLATARSLQYGNKWLRVFCFQELPIWLLYERGGGGATKRAAKKWLQGIPPWRQEGNQADSVRRYFKAGGNGVAMRILPHVLLPEQTAELIHQRVMLNGITTHGHPRALLGALLYAKAVWFAFKTEGPLRFGSLIEHLVESKDEWAEIPRWKLNYEEWWEAGNKYTNGGYAEEWTTVVDEVLTGLQICRDAMHKGALDVDSEVLERLGCFDKQTNGAGTIAALSAIYLASRYAADPVPGMLEAAFADGADTDTIASMLGGLLGSFRGTEWILPEWKIVQDSKYLRHIAEVIAGISIATAVDDEFHVEPWTEKMSADVLNSLVDSQTDELELGLLGSAKVIDTIENQPLTKSTVVKSWKLVTGSGQTLYIKKLSRQKQKSQKNEILTETSKVDQFKPDSIPRTISFLKNLSDHFPPQFTAKMAFDIAAEVIETLEQEGSKFGAKSMASRIRDENYSLHLIEKIPILKESEMEPKAIMEVARIIWDYLVEITVQWQS